MIIFETINKSLHHKIELQPPVYPKVLKLLLALILSNTAMRFNVSLKTNVKYEK